ncbi:MAG: hypothetical protein M9896_04420 [Candidatus Promineofilum sp.]|uniref:hypothetical protein n=1 Tax=Promineifilum sp. TaxID=2664178 RepID=UPI002411B2CE|nr:hypothetical protein [Promineifilum sp.]
MGLLSADCADWADFGSGRAGLTGEGGVQPRPNERLRDGWCMAGGGQPGKALVPGRLTRLIG